MVPSVAAASEERAPGRAESVSTAPLLVANFESSLSIPDGAKIGGFCSSGAPVPPPAPAVKFAAPAMLHSEEMPSTARSGLQRRGKKSLTETGADSVAEAASRAALPEYTPSTVVQPTAPAELVAPANASVLPVAFTKAVWMVALMFALMVVAFLSGSALHGSHIKGPTQTVVPMHRPFPSLDPSTHDALALGGSGNFEMRMEVRPQSPADEWTPSAGRRTEAGASSVTDLQRKRSTPKRAVQAHTGSLRRLLAQPLKMVEKLLSRVLAGLSYYRRLFD
jgi:hypothetical protein